MRPESRRSCYPLDGTHDVAWCRCVCHNQEAGPCDYNVLPPGEV